MHTHTQRVSRLALLTFVVGAVLLLGARTEARLSSNKLSPIALAEGKAGASTLAAHKLAARELAPNTFLLNLEGANDLVTTSNGLELLTYIVSCALPQGVTLVSPSGQEFLGEIGLVEHWLHHPLDKKGKGWISACLFARVNEHDEPVPIALRGPHPALTVDPGEEANWTIEQGAFYGDYFASDGEAIACSGRNETLAENFLRDCAAQDPLDPSHTKCGFVAAGACGDFAPVFACEDMSKLGFYRDCHEQALCALGQQQAMCAPDHRSEEFRQVITVFVHP